LFSKNYDIVTLTKIKTENEFPNLKVEHKQKVKCLSLIKSNVLKLNSK